MVSFLNRVVGLFRGLRHSQREFFDDGYVVVWISCLHSVYGHRYDSVMCRDGVWRSATEPVEEIKANAVVFRTFGEAEKAAAEATERLFLDEDDEVCVVENARVAIDMITDAQRVVKTYNERL